MNLFSKIIKKILRNNIYFSKIYYFLKDSEKKDFNYFLEYQKNQFEFISSNIIKFINYYRKEIILPSVKFKNIPLLDKDIIQENLNFFRNRHKFVYSKGYTSGTSGSPGTFYRDLNSIIWENAFLWRFYGWAGINRENNRRITLRGEMVKDINSNEPPFWYENKNSNELILSSYHLNNRNLKFYYEKIKQFKPNNLYCYPSAGFILAEYLNENGLDLKLSAVFTSSEMLLDYQKEMMENVFQCKVFDWYGQAERVSAIATCEYGTYHIIPEYSITELIPTGNNLYEIVGTTLHNYVMPLVRYRTGDLVEIYPDDYKCKCGRNFKCIKRIIGRSEDIIILPDGRKIGRLDHIFKNLENIKECQIIQLDIGRIIFKVVKQDNSGINFIKEEIIKNARKYLGNQVNIEIEFVDKIERDKNGKFRAVISKL
jgi:phenylacetate-CoA ligase